MIVTVTLNPAFDKALSVDALCPGALHRADTGPVVPSGKGINVARVVHAWGVPAVAVALAGAGGDRLAEFLASCGIDHCILPVAGEIRTNIKLYETKHQRMTEINEPGPIVTAQDLFQLEKTLLAFDHPEMVVFSGSLPPGAPADTYARLARVLAERKVPVVVDTSGAALRCAVQEQLYAIKPNRLEASELAGPAACSDLQLLAELNRFGIPHVILTLGAQGALFCSEGRTFSVAPPQIKAGNAAGAGDALLATYLTGVVLRWPLEQRLTRAVAAGAAAARGLGTDLATPQEVSDLEGLVQISPYNA